MSTPPRTSSRRWSRRSSAISAPSPCPTSSAGAASSPAISAARSSACSPTVVPVYGSGASDVP
jgi:hypothetical protein